jgi:hypothetical protein
MPGDTEIYVEYTYRIAEYIARPTIITEGLNRDVTSAWKQERE